MNEPKNPTHSDVPPSGQAQLALLEALSASVGVTPRRRRPRISAIRRPTYEATMTPGAASAGVLEGVRSAVLCLEARQPNATLRRSAA